MPEWHDINITVYIEAQGRRDGGAARRRGIAGERLKRIRLTSTFLVKNPFPIGHGRLAAA
jgi:hypothetical protein